MHRSAQQISRHFFNAAWGPGDVLEAYALTYVIFKATIAQHHGLN